MARLYLLVTLMLALGACGDDGANNNDRVDAPVSEAILTASPGSFDFGAVGAGTTSSFATITVGNTGIRASGKVTTQLSNTDASSFKIINDGCNTGVVPANGNCIIEVQFRPMTVSGLKRATLIISAAPGGDVIVELTGNAVMGTGAMITASTNSITFADQSLGTLSPATIITLTQTGGAPSGPINVQLTGTNTNVFGVETSCSAPLQPQGTCTVAVKFHPTASGFFQAVVNLAASPGGAVTLALGGRGIDTRLVMSPATYDFASVGITSTSVAQNFTIMNTGTQSTGSITTLLAGMHPADFRLESDSCTGSLIGPGSSCSFAVRFDPEALGPRSATLRASANGTSAMLSVSATAITEGPAFLAANPTNLTFADQTVNMPSTPKLVTLTNYGGVDTGPISFTISGLGGASFSTTSTCTSLAPAETCTVMVTFRPVGAGPQQASISASSPSTSVGIGAQGNGI